MSIKPTFSVRQFLSVRNILRCALLLGILSFATEREGRAYTDPGSGAMIWQTLLVAFAGALYYWGRFKRWVKRKRGSND